MRSGLALLWIAGIAGCGCGREEGAPGSPAQRSDGERDPSAGWLVDVAPDVGLTSVHHSGARGERHMPEIMGAGLALFDCDGDGDLDVFLTGGNDLLPDTRAAAAGHDRLFRQEEDGRFVDATASSGLSGGGYDMGAAVGDVDNDGDLDLFVTSYGPARLYRNLGGGSFEDVTRAAGAGVEGWSTSAAFFDADRDGFLDLYVARYVAYDPAMKCRSPAGRPDYCDPKVFSPLPDVLLRNRGDGTFEDVSARAGIAAIPPGAGLGVVCADLDEDGWQDVYVANDQHPNECWINRGDLTFREQAVVLGAAYGADGMAQAGMGVAAVDVDRDRDLDLLVTNLRGETNALYRSLGAGRGFRDDNAPSGFGPPSVPFTGFGIAAFDLELDGDLDVAIVDGRVARPEERPANDDPVFGPYAERNLLFLAREGRFELAAGECGAFCARADVTRGLAAGDVDRDGDVDLVTACVGGPVRFYRNVAPRRGRWLVVRPFDPALSRIAIGARVEVAVGDEVFVGLAIAGTSYLSSSDPEVHFGLGSCARVEHVSIRWPDGMRERFAAHEVDRRIELVRGEGERLP